MLILRIALCIASALSVSMLLLFYLIMMVDGIILYCSFIVIYCIVCYKASILLSRIKILFDTSSDAIHSTKAVYLCVNSVVLLAS